MTESRRSTGAPTARRWGRAAIAIAGLALAGTGMVPGTGQASAHADAVTDGSDWGSQGTLSSDSAVTVRWDNVGNPSTDVVPRDGRQVIPHSGGQTYDDIAPATAAAYAADFSNVAVDVSQTTGLDNQAITLKFSGARQGAPIAGMSSPDYFQVFQCWGGVAGDGSPDLGAANPDPATCQVGAVGPDSRGPVNHRAETRVIGGDPLAATGDWKAYHDAGALSPDQYVPFTSISGEQSDGDASDAKDKFFSGTSTNELSNVSVETSGSAVRQFEAQTTIESSGLGCGVESGVASTGNCWLVVVPRIDTAVGLRTTGPISPTLWAQRLQVKLQFSPITTGCPGGQSRSLFGGSELLVSAGATWTPGLCDSRQVALGYTRLGDQTARNEFATGAEPAILASDPPGSAPSVAVPVSVAAPTIAYQLSYNPTCFNAPDPVATDSAAQECGYTDLADAQNEFAKAGTPVTDLKLDARLVAKLLTQSYGDALMRDQTLAVPDWVQRARPASLLYDPEFQRLNPDMSHLEPSAEGSIDHLVAEGLRSDAAAAVWRWILSDPDATAFVNGCPDPQGMMINPFFSTRTYAGCSDQKAALSAQADADRAASTKAPSYVDQPLSYPPDGSPFPLPTWEELDRDGFPVKTVIDQLPPVDNMSVSGRDVGIGHAPRNDTWCENDNLVTDPSCGLPPGRWKDGGGRQNPTQIGLAGLTDAATAAQWRLPTARLCDSSGTHCVGADTTSLQKAASEFTPGNQGWLEPGPTDLAGGAYPLTMPVYAAVNPDLPLDQRQSYADALDYITTSGQTPGFGPGNLPPGYAPITSAMRAQAQVAIAQLRTADPTPTPTRTKHATTPKKHSPPSAQPSASTAAGPSGGGTPPAPSAAVPTVATATGAAPVTKAPLVSVSAGTESWASYTVPLGLAIALLAGLAGPLMRLRGRVRVSR